MKRAQACWKNSSLPKKILLVIRFFASSSLFLALNSVFVVYFSFLLYGIDVSSPILLAVFLSTFSVYGLNKVTDQVEDSINKPEIASKSQTYYLIPSIVCCLISLGIGALEGPLVFTILLTPLIIGFVYSVKICKLLPRLKEMLGVKSIFVAFSWAFTGSLLPAAIGLVDVDKILLVFMYIFIGLFVNTVLFDVLDIEGDKVSGVKTIPMVLGRSGTMYLLVAVNSLLFFWVGLCWFFGLFVRDLPALVFGAFYGYAVICYFTKNKRKRLSAELIVDGEWLPIVAFLRAIVR